MSRTISNSYSTGITLTNTADNPVLVTGMITATNAYLFALYGQGGAGNSWTISNSGSLLGEGLAAIGIGSEASYAAYGSVTNLSGGVLEGFGDGINFFGPGSVTNLAGGTINGTSIDGIEAAASILTVVNNGVLLGGSFGIVVGGGSVSNLANGTIAGADGILVESAGTVFNAGTITQYAIGSQYYAVRFAASSDNNRVIVAPGAEFNGRIIGRRGVVELTSASSAGTLSGFGTTITNFTSLQFDAGAQWTVAGNTAGLGTIDILGFTIGDTLDLTGFAAVHESFASNALVLTDASNDTATLHIEGGFSSGNFLLAANGSGGTFITSTGTTLSGTYTTGVVLSNPNENPVAVTGAISNTGGYALYGTAGTISWTIDNSGTIVGRDGVELGTVRNSVPGGLVVNEAGGLITGGELAVEIWGSASVTNQAGGTISAASGSGIRIGGLGTIINRGDVLVAGQAAYAYSGGSVINYAGATLSGSGGVRFEGVGTVTNAGVIIGTDPGMGAILFGVDSTSNRLIADPGAVFQGYLFGAYGVVELASGSSAGTLSGFGSTIKNFHSLQFDAGATWTVAGNVAGLGELTISGFTANETIDLSGFVAVSDTFANNTLVLENASNNYATLHILGGFGSGNFYLADDGSGGTFITAQGDSFPGTYTTGITLTSQVANPVAVSGRISAASGYGLYGQGGGANSWTLVNTGTIIGLGGVAFGSLASAVSNGVVINEATGLISAASSGVYIFGPVSVTNQAGGTIVGTANGAVNIRGGLGTVVNSGVLLSGNTTLSVAVYEYNGGSVTDFATGTIAGAGGVRFNAPGTFIDAGVVIGNNNSLGAVDFLSNSSSNRLIIAPTAVIDGYVFGGEGVVELESASTVGTLTGLGSSIVNFSSLLLDTSATWLIAGNNSASGLGTIDISGFGFRDTIDLTGFAAVSDSFTSNGLVLTDASSDRTTLHIQGNFNSSNFHIASDGQGGTFITSTGTTISGTYPNGVVLTSMAENPVVVTGRVSAADTYALYGPGGGSNSWTIDNFGSIVGAGEAIVLGSSGSHIAYASVTNEASGLIDGAGGLAINIHGAASIINRAGGTIAGYGIYISGANTIINAGLMQLGLNGIYEHVGGSVTNLAGGTIIGSSGAYFAGIGTFANAGVVNITGDFGASAVAFHTYSTSNRLIATPGAVFDGKIRGGDGVLELTSASNRGALAGLGVSITNFSELQFDAGASWTVSGNSSANGLGTIDIVGFTINDTIDLTDFVAVSESFASNALVLTNASNAQVTLDIQGNFSSRDFHIASDGSGGTFIKTSGTTFTGTYTNGITLTSTADDPAFVTGRIAVSSGVALYAVGGAAYNWTIINSGTIAGPNEGILLGLGRSQVGYGLVINEAGGLIDGTGGTGVELSGPGSITNQAGGTIAAGFDNAIYTANGPVTIVNGGVLSSLRGVGLTPTIHVGGGGQVTNLAGATIIGTTAIVFDGSNNVLVNAGTIIGTNSAFSAVWFANIATSNRLIVDPGAVFQGNINGGLGVLELASASNVGSLSGFGTSIIDFRTLQFDPAAQWLVAGNTSGLFGTSLNGLTIGGFTVSDTIDLTGFVAVSESFASNLLVLSDSIGDQTTLHIEGDFSSDNFHLASDNNAGTYITVCYLAGTRIRTDRGEITVERLAIGDRVITLSGEAKPIKWIGRRSYASAFAAGNRDVVPILIKQGALGDNLPLRDLCVSPAHALFFDGVLIQAEHLVNGVSILRCPDIDPIRYFHIELDQHDVIFAEGAPAETFVDCDSRFIFHNAAEFAQLYPGDPARPWRFCAPRIESGPILERVRRVIDARAGLATPEGDATCGPLHGMLDGLNGSTISGWTFDPTMPGRPVSLDVLDGDGLIARVTANRFREDLEIAGIGDGRHGFELRLANRLSPESRHEIRVRRVIDGQELHGSPLVIEAQAGPVLLQDAGQAIDLATQAAGDQAALDALLATLLQGVDRVRQLQATYRPAADDDARLLRWDMGERQRPKRALFVDDCWPRRDRDAGSNAVLSHVAALQALGWSVDFVASRELTRGDDDAAALAASGVTCHRWPKITSVEEVLRRNRGLFDLVYLHRLSNAETYAAMVRNWLPQARVLYSVADLHHVRLARQARVQASQELLQESQRLKQRELLAMRWADAVITHSTDEAAYLAREVPGARVHVVPWAVTPGRARKPLHHRAGIAFIGGYRHAPNPDAVRWLAETIMPLVWQRHPTLRCFVVGPGWPEQPRRATDPRLRFVGPVPRLDEVFDMVRLTVAPLRFGAGLKGKVLDSLAAGVPCVMTPIAAEGLGLPPALAGLVTDDAARFAALIGDLHERSALNQDHAAAGQALVRQRFDAATVQRELARAVSADLGITQYTMTA